MIHADPSAARSVHLHLDGKPMMGCVRACLDDELVVSLPLQSVLPVGRRVDMKVTGGDLSEPLGARGTVRRRVEAPNGRLYGLAHGLATLRGPKPSPVQANRRTETRHLSDEVIPVLLQSNGVNTAGYLIDVSKNGLGVRLVGRAEGAMALESHTVVRFVPPGKNIQVVRTCSIRSRVLDDRGLRYGLQFEMPQELQSLWDCSGCGQPALLDASHAFCPGCAKQRGRERAYLVEWDRLPPPSDHRFSGDEADCHACGAAWGATASFCGQCGTCLT